MKARTSLLFMTVSLAAAIATAQVDPDPDGIGVYFDEAATLNSATGMPGESVAGYLVATHLSRAGEVHEWHTVVRATGMIVQLYGTVRDGINAYTNMPGLPWFAFVGVTSLPVADVVVLADLTFDLGALQEPGLIYLEGLESAPYPVYALEDPSPFYDMYPSSGDVGLPVASINAVAPVATPRCAWSDVKTLYR